MFIVLLTFSDNRTQAGALMPAHNAWIARGFDDGVFLVVGSLPQNQGGALLVHRTTRAQLEQRVQEDPFVAEGVVHAQVLELTPSRVDARLAFLTA
jgi:uncharacterized protein YciI